MFKYAFTLWLRHNHSHAPVLHRSQHFLALFVFESDRNPQSKKKDQHSFRVPIVTYASCRATFQTVGPPNYDDLHPLELYKIVRVNKLTGVELT